MVANSKSTYTSNPKTEESLFYWSVGPTFSLYRLARTTILDLGSNKDFLNNSRSKLAPGICLNVGYHSYPLQFNYGLKVSYAHRNAGITNDYWEQGQTVSLFDVQQDIRDMRFTPYLEWKKQCKNRFAFAISAGAGFSIKTVDNFKVYEKATQAYIGQRLAAESLNYLGEFGGKIQYTTKQEWNFILDYTFTLGNAHYKRNIYIETPDPAASETFLDEALLIDASSILLPKHPHLKIRSHRFSLSFGADF